MWGLVNATAVGDRQIATQRCAFTDDNGYCANPATEHLATIGLNHPGEGHTMTCGEHCGWFDSRRHLVRDHHPVGGACGMPGTSWVDSAEGFIGWCWIDSDDWTAS